MSYYVDYPAWIDYLERIFKKFRVQPRHILDLACGTGIPTVLLARRGYRLTGVDRSAEMLAVLESKKGDLPIATIQADMTDFTLPEPVDAAISLYDSMNYLLTEADLTKCFLCVRRALTPEGIFAFDMNTVYSLSRFWGNRTSSRNVGGVASVWQNTFDWKTMISTLHLTFWEEAQAANGGQREEKTPAIGSEPVRYEEEHRERAYTIRQVRRCLERAGFPRACFFDHGTFLPVNVLTVRMMVVARPQR